MAAAKSEGFWRRVVSEVEGGKGVGEVARRHGVSASSVLRWRAKLGSATATSLVPIRVSAACPPSRGEAGPGRRVKLEVGEVGVYFEEGTDPGYVAAVARALGV
jgi:hypothetical protein